MNFLESPITVELLEIFFSEGRVFLTSVTRMEELFFILEESRNLNISAIVTKL